ncbi:hypothetical protein RvY_14909-2 [Ramazzottius varieornatus]|uniref:Uncharacterized protein n=1 Tax=Ramazzottius varieornatus TaxID=947166 RepID=A0A1D1VSY4_RAMVA|nr:hypothetical protein RvY_14909-2 [Ramazzottius varieornatus]
MLQQGEPRILEAEIQNWGFSFSASTSIAWGWGNGRSLPFVTADPLDTESHTQSWIASGWHHMFYSSSVRHISRHYCIFDIRNIGIFTVFVSVFIRVSSNGSTEMHET